MNEDVQRYLFWLYVFIEIYGKTWESIDPPV